MIVPDVSTLRKKGMECFCIRYNLCGTVKDGHGEAVWFSSGNIYARQTKPNYIPNQI